MVRKNSYLQTLQKIPWVKPQTEEQKKRVAKSNRMVQHRQRVWMLIQYVYNTVLLLSLTAVWKTEEMCNWTRNCCHTVTEWEVPITAGRRWLWYWHFWDHVDCSDYCKFLSCIVLLTTIQCMLIYCQTLWPPCILLAYDNHAYCQILFNFFGLHPPLHTQAKPLWKAL